MLKRPEPPEAPRFTLREAADLLGVPLPEPTGPEPPAGLPRHREVFSPAEVAEHLGLSLRFIERRIAAGEIDSIRVGRLRRVPRAEIERILAEGL